MSSQFCRKARAILSVSGIDADAAVSGELTIFDAGQITGANLRQRIIELYDELRPSLQAYLCCLGMTSDQAEDVIQEAFLRLVRFRVERATEDNLRAWLFRVAHNLSMDVHRFQRRWAQNEGEKPEQAIRRRADPAPSPEQQVLLDERMKRFQQAFALLTPKQRECVLLRVEGFRYREIALTLGISVQRVGELMQRSISLLGIHIS